MRILYEILHTAFDREIILTGHDFTALFPISWNESERPCPANIDLSGPQPSDEFDLAVVGTPEGFERACGFNVPIIFKAHLDYGNRILAPDILNRVSAVVGGSPETLGFWNLAHNPKGRSINFAVDLDVFQGYTGETSLVLTVGSLIPKRPEKGIMMLRDVDARIRVDLMGSLNEGYGHWIGPSRNMEHLAETYRRYRVYFNPCPVVGVAVCEALATGMPLVTVKPGNFKKVLEHGWNCLIVDTPDEAVKSIAWLLDCPNARLRLSRAARETAVKYFDAKSIRKEWNSLFESLIGAGVK